MLQANPQWECTVSSDSSDGKLVIQNAASFSLKYIQRQFDGFSTIGSHFICSENPSETIEVSRSMKTKIELERMNGE